MYNISKYHGCGNNFVIMQEAELAEQLDMAAIDGACRLEQGKEDGFLVTVPKNGRKIDPRKLADALRAALAALLHDAAKEISKDEMCAIMQAHPEYAEGGEARPTPVWHGVCASILARTEWGVTDEAVLSAIACHTAGKPGMTQLDKILYLADMTSAERDWPGVEKLRKLELKDLDAAMLAALKQTNDFVLSQGKPLDPMSKAAYEDILAHSAQNGENA